MLRESTPEAAESDKSLPNVPMAPFSSKCQNHSHVLLSAHILAYILHGAQAFLRC